MNLTRHPLSIGIAVAALSTSALTGVLMSGVAHAAPTPMTALINGDSVTTGDGITDASNNPISLEQYAAQRAGYTVTVVDGATWDSMTQAQFAQYSLLVIGDPFCSTTPASAFSNSSTWAPVVMGSAGGNTQPGNRAIIGTDPEDHYALGGGGAQPTNPSDPSTAGAEHLVQAGIQFAGDGPAGTTGVYLDTGCGEEFSPGGDIPTMDMLTTTGAGHWNEDASPPCGGSVQQIASVPEFSIVSDADIQGWSCSDHTTWPGFPADFNAEAVATDTPTTPTCGTDPGLGTTACGEAYVILAGSGITATAPDLTLTPASHSDTVGGSHTVTATVTQSGSADPGATVTFAIGSGPNAGATGTCTLSNSTADPGCTSGSDGEVLFTYSDTGGAGTDEIDASVTLSGSTEHATATETWGGTSAKTVTLSGTAVSATEGESFAGQTASFTDTNASSTASEYTASIDWGDGTTTAGTVTGPTGGPYDVDGMHTYADEHTGYTVRTSITDSLNSANDVSATSTATVADAALAASCATPALSADAFNGTAATFTDGNAGATTADFTATIDWGDGSTSSGTVSGSTGGPFTVSGSHTYPTTGGFTTYNVTTSISDDGGSTAASSGSSCNVTVGNGIFSISQPESANGTHVYFWGSQWARHNPFSGSSGPASYKGFDIAGTLTCGAQILSSTTGNSPAPPPGPLASEIPVVVLTGAHQVGSTITGTVAHIVLVQVNPGYGPAPGQTGTGTVVSQVC